MLCLIDGRQLGPFPGCPWVFLWPRSGVITHKIAKKKRKNVGGGEEAGKFLVDDDEKMWKKWDWPQISLFPQVHLLVGMQVLNLRWQSDRPTAAYPPPTFVRNDNMSATDTGTASSSSVLHLRIKVIQVYLHKHFFCLFFFFKWRERERGCERVVSRGYL